MEQSNITPVSYTHLDVYKRQCIDCVYSIIHIVAPFLKKETELLTALLYRQQPRKSTMASENLMPRLPDVYKRQTPERKKRKPSPC